MFGRAMPAQTSTSSHQLRKSCLILPEKRVCCWSVYFEKFRRA